MTRDSLIHCARVYLTEARRSRHWHGWHAKLLAWAARCRREAGKGQMGLPL